MTNTFLDKEQRNYTENSILTTVPAQEAYYVDTKAEKELDNDKITDKIQTLLQSNQKNYYEIGRYLSTIKAKLTKKEYINFLQDERIGVQYSHSITIIGFYEFISEQEKMGRTTDHLFKMDLEKVYLISNIDNKEQQPEFEELIKKYNPNVKILKKMKNVLNENYKKLKNNEINKNEKLSVDEAYEQVKIQKQPIKQNIKQPAASSDDTTTLLRMKYEVLETENEELKIENEKLTDEIKRLKEQLKEFKEKGTGGG